jgi:hypothetical protein
MSYLPDCPGGWYFWPLALSAQLPYPAQRYDTRGKRPHSPHWDEAGTFENAKGDADRAKSCRGGLDAGVEQG